MYTREATMTNPSFHHADLLNSLSNSDPAETLDDDFVRADPIESNPGEDFPIEQGESVAAQPGAIIYDPDTGQSYGPGHYQDYRRDHDRWGHDRDHHWGHRDHDRDHRWEHDRDHRWDHDRDHHRDHDRDRHRDHDRDHHRDHDRWDHHRDHNPDHHQHYGPADEPIDPDHHQHYGPVDEPIDDGTVHVDPIESHPGEDVAIEPEMSVQPVEEDPTAVHADDLPVE
jgi:hypothetical protein